MAVSLSGERLGRFSQVLLQVDTIVDGKLRTDLVDILDLFLRKGEALALTMSDPPSTTLGLVQSGIAAYCAQFLTVDSMIPFQKVGVVGFNLTDALALKRALANALFESGLQVTGQPAITETLQFNYPAGSSTKQDLATVLGAISGQGQRTGWTTYQQEYNL